MNSIKKVLWSLPPLAALASIALLGAETATDAEATADRGRQVFEQICFACHAADGTGALGGVPDLTDPAGRLAKDDETLFLSIRDGLSTPGAALAMPPRGGNPALTDEDLLAALGYIRTAFGSTEPGTVSITLTPRDLPPPAAAAEPLAPPPDPGTVADFGRGARLWANNCNRCHNLRDPMEFDDDDWAVIVSHMRIRAGLRRKDAQDIAAFLQSSNAPE